MGGGGVTPGQEGGGRYCHLVRMGGYPISDQDGGYPTSWPEMGYPHPGQLPGQDGGYPLSAGWGYPPPIQVPSQDGGGEVTPNQNNIACICYAAGGMPLAFTQEDFLVWTLFQLFALYF